MLHAISWASFLKWLSLATLLYYCGIGLLFYHKKLVGILKRRKKLLLLAPALTGIAEVRAQDGNQGLQQANTLIRGYYDTATQLMYAIAGILALAGAIHVYYLWSDSHGGSGGNAQRAALAWLAGCIFIVIVAAVIRSFFGL